MLLPAHGKEASWKLGLENAAPLPGHTQPPSCMCVCVLVHVCMCACACLCMCVYARVHILMQPYSWLTCGVAYTTKRAGMLQAGTEPVPVPIGAPMPVPH